MPEPSKQTDVQPAKKAATPQTAPSPNPTPSAPQPTLTATLGNQAMLRLMRPSVPPVETTRQREAHERGCGCPSCARVQRQHDGQKLQRDVLQREGTGTTAASIPFSELLALWRERDQKSKPQVPPTPSVHAPVTIQGGPASAAEVRGKVSSAAPGSAGAVALLAERVKELQNLSISSEVPTQADLIPILAEDMERKDQAKAETERQNLSKDQWLAAAKSQIEGNKTTALTTSDDRYTAIKGGDKFDELHEFIHICSGTGGESPLMAFKLQVNEGAINVFSELVAEALGIPVVTRYTAETPIMKKLVALIGADGIGKLFDATFKGDVDGFFAAVGEAYVNLGTKMPNGKNKAFSEKKWTADEAGAEFKKQIQNWSLDWLNQRLP